jgi:hypothetical protein
MRPCKRRDLSIRNAFLPKRDARKSGCRKHPDLLCFSPLQGGPKRKTGAKRMVIMDGWERYCCSAKQAFLGRKAAPRAPRGFAVKALTVGVWFGTRAAQVKLNSSCKRRGEWQAERDAGARSVAETQRARSRCAWLFPKFICINCRCDGHRRREG